MGKYHSQLFADVDHPVGNWISIGHPAVAEICANGFDFVVVDLEHTDITLESLGNVLRAVETVEGDVNSFVRVSWNDPIEIKRVLDLGPAGIIVPQVESANEAKQVVQAMQYPPEGDRGVAPTRASDYGRTFDEYVERIDDEVVTVVQIETTRGVDNAQEIVGVDGVDAVLIGQGDLSASLGVIGDWDDEQFRSAHKSIVEAVHDAGKPVWMLAMDDDGIHRWTETGIDVLIAGIDAAYLAKGSDTAREKFEETISSRDEQN